MDDFNKSVNLLYDDRFDIRNYVERLIPTGQKNRFVCPVCNGSNLTIQSETGAYQCWNGCEVADIRQAIAPTEKTTNFLHKSKRKPSKEKPKKTINIPSGATLLIAAELSDIPKPKPLTPKRPKGVPQHSTQTTYYYSDDQWVIRFQWEDSSKAKGYDKTFRQYNRLPDGTVEMKKGDRPWMAYRLDEVLAHINDVEVPAVLWGEGEKCVEIARSDGILSLTLQGSAWNKADIVRSLEPIAKANSRCVQVFIADTDATGEKKAKTFSDACAEVELPCLVISPEMFEVEGDIEQILDSMETPEFIKRLEDEIQAAAFKKEVEEGLEEELKQLSPKKTLNQQAFEVFFGDRPWICADSKLYRWEGNCYKLVHDDELIPPISAFCNQFAVEKRGEIIYPHANTRSVKEVLSWAKLRLTVPVERLNPPGINCTNGIVRIKWEGNVPTVELQPHSPDYFYTYSPLVAYDPFADDTHCDRLLQSLDPEQQEVLLRNLAASIDLPTIRRIRGREVKVLLLSGLGSNGKDSLREVVSTIWGDEGMTSCSLADFASYDDGRKFSLAPLMASRINWASENPQTSRLDKIQALKLFVTGNKLHAERKGKDHIEFTPKATGLFNVNEAPSLQGTMQAILDRIAVLQFRKTFKSKPDTRNPNELLADPRFAYDPDFIRTEVAPAFLNRMLKALVDLCADGIDYECTEDAFKDIQKANNHLFQFCEDVDLEAIAGQELTAKEIWQVLEQWYIDQGTLNIAENGKRQWVDQAKPGDKNVKGLNQVIARISQLFPQAKRGTRYCSLSHRSVPILTGVGFSKPVLESPPQSIVAESVATQSEKVPEQSKPAVAEEVATQLETPQPSQLTVPSKPQQLQKLTDEEWLFAANSLEKINPAEQLLFRLANNSVAKSHVTWQKFKDELGSPSKMLKKIEQCRKTPEQEHIVDELYDGMLAQLLFEHIELTGDRTDLELVPDFIRDQFNELVREFEQQKFKKGQQVKFEGELCQVLSVDGDWLKILSLKTNRNLLVFTPEEEVLILS